MSFELQDFNTEVVIRSKTTPVVIDFWAEWCGPCKALSPILEKLAAGAAGRWNLVKIDTEKHRQLAAQFGIRSIPSVKMVYQGAIIAEFQGAMPEAAVRKWLMENLPGGDEPDGDAELINELLAAGDRGRAKALIEEQLRETDDTSLKVMLAMLSLPAGIDDAETLMKGTGEEPRFEIERETLATIKYLNDIHQGKVQIPDESKAAKSYLNGVNALFSIDFEAAAESFLDAMIRNRKLDNDGARKALIAMFTMLTDKHPVSTGYRRRFSMALY